MAFKSNMLFDVLSNILTTKSIPMYIQHIKSDSFKDASKFMVLRYLTMSQVDSVRNIVLDNYLTLEKMPEQALYKWLLMHVPKQKSGFIRYIR